MVFPLVLLNRIRPVSYIYVLLTTDGLLVTKATGWVLIINYKPLGQSGDTQSGCPTQPHRKKVRQVWPDSTYFIYLDRYPGYFVFNENPIRGTIATIVTSH